MLLPSTVTKICSPLFLGSLQFREGCEAIGVCVRLFVMIFFIYSPASFNVQLVWASVWSLTASPVKVPPRTMSTPLNMQPRL